MAGLYRPGGLMRCCTETLRLGTQEGDLPIEPGSIFPCKYCGNEMFVNADGDYEWAGAERERMPSALRVQHNDPMTGAMSTGPVANKPCEGCGED